MPLQFLKKIFLIEKSINTNLDLNCTVNLNEHLISIAEELLT